MWAIQKARRNPDFKHCVSMVKAKCARDAPDIARCVGKAEGVCAQTPQLINLARLDTFLTQQSVAKQRKIAQ